MIEGWLDRRDNTTGGGGPKPPGGTTGVDPPQPQGSMWLRGSGRELRSRSFGIGHKREEVFLWERERGGVLLFRAQAFKLFLFGWDPIPVCQLCVSCACDLVRFGVASCFAGWIAGKRISVPGRRWLWIGFLPQCVVLVLRLFWGRRGSLHHLLLVFVYGLTLGYPARRP